MYIGRYLLCLNVHLSISKHNNLLEIVEKRFRKGLKRFHALKTDFYMKNRFMCRHIRAMSRHIEGKFSYV